MKFLRDIISVVLLFCTSFIFAQDIHFTQFDLSPLTLNPAFSGSYEGTFRVGGIYRNQMYNIGTNVYETPSLYIDAPLFRGFRKYDWVGAGLMFYNDQAGTAKLTNQAIQLSLAYHLALNKKRTSVLTLGVQGGTIMRSFDPALLVFEDEVLDPTGPQSMDRQNFVGGQDDPNTNFFDINAGLLFSSSLNKNMSMKLGVGFYHLNGGESRLNNRSTVDEEKNQPLRFTLHGTFDISMAEKWKLFPGFMWQRLSSANETAVQATLGYQFTPKVMLRLGPAYRIGDAAALMLGVDYDNIRVGMAWDVTLSDLAEVNKNHGALEIGASYILKIHKKPDVPTVIFCPRL